MPEEKPGGGSYQVFVRKLFRVLHLNAFINETKSSVKLHFSSDLTN